jgi:hypothetical protein
MLTEGANGFLVHLLTWLPVCLPARLLSISHQGGTQVAQLMLHSPVLPLPGCNNLCAGHQLFLFPCAYDDTPIKCPEAPPICVLHVCTAAQVAGAPGTAKVHQAHKDGKHVVSPDWLQACMLR